MSRITAHLAKKGKRWYVVLNLTDPVTGKRKKKWVSTGLTKVREAEDARVRILAEYNEGSYIDPNTVTVADLMERWLEDVIKLGSSSRYDRYESISRNHIVPFLGQLRVQDLTVDQIQRFYATQFTSGRLVVDGKERVRSGAPLSEATVRKHHNVLMAAIDQAATWKLIPANVFRDALVLPKQEYEDEDAGEIQYWTPEEVTRFLTAAKGRRTYPAYALALGTGLRQGELFSLQWDDLDFERNTLSVKRTLRQPSAPPRFGPPKTKKSRRTIDVSPTIMALLKRVKVKQAEERLKLGSAYEDYNLVFAQPNGRPMHPNNLSKREFVRLKEKAGVTDITWHGMRHTHATDLIRRGYHAKLISERLGHASIVVTMDVYGHLMPGAQSDAATAIDDLLPQEG